MLIEHNSKYLLKKTRAKAKMFEYGVPIEDHVYLEKSSIDLVLLAVAIIGDVSNYIWNNRFEEKIDIDEEVRKELQFSSSYFDSLVFSKATHSQNNSYFLLLGAIAYYFCNQIGSSKVLLKEIDPNFNISAKGIENVLLAILTDNPDSICDFLLEEPYKVELQKVILSYENYFEKGVDIDFRLFENLKMYTYIHGSPRELFLVDALIAVLKKKITNSSLHLMPVYTGIDKDEWHKQLLSPSNKVKELWPAQIRLGEKGVFSGTSAVIQMPISSGKTTSIALIIKSAFLSKRTELSVIVAPFRALCKEITREMVSFFSDDKSVKINELSDVPNLKDLSFFKEKETEDKNILILTPEKLIFLLRQDKGILEKMGLIVFDEAHLFDDKSRGIGYELLISTINHYIDSHTQKVLISAVMSNGSIINNWLNGDKGVCILDSSIKSSEKTIAIGDWKGHTGLLYFINPENPDDEEFFVPRVVEIQELKKKGKERKQRTFPEVDFENSKVKSNDMSIYYANKLIHNGGVAIFCGNKKSVNIILQRILYLEERGINISGYIENVKENENRKIAFLIENHFGTDNFFYEAALKGIYAHHASIPLGIKLSIEYAISKDLVRCVVCTSTLAQGVNLPIKYLIISSLYQAREEIKVRDFHNLIGRTGRAGKHTEGTVILSEPFVYSEKINRRKNWKWKNYKRILNASNSEDCVSQLLITVQSVNIETGDRNNPLVMDLNDIVKERYKNLPEYNKKRAGLKEKIAANKNPKVLVELDKVLDQVESKLVEIENYILSLSQDDSLITANELILETLGYYQASDSEKILLMELFDTIKEFINLIPIDEQKLLSKASLGVFKSLSLKQWITVNKENIVAAETEKEFVNMLLEKILELSGNPTLNRLLKTASFEDIENILMLWVRGKSYQKILEYCNETDIQILRRKKLKPIELNEIIEICDNGFGYSLILPMNAIRVFFDFDEEHEDVANAITELSKKMKYGLPDLISINLFEIGFSDRVVAQLLANKFKEIKFLKKSRIKKILHQKYEVFEQILYPFPQYFVNILNQFK